MAALATLQDFEARHGDQPESEHACIEALLDDATGLIRSEASALTDEWATDVDNAEKLDAVKTVCVQVAYRAWSNPDAVAREQLGEHSRTLRGTDQSDAIWLTANERRIVRRAASGGAISSIALESPYPVTDRQYHPMDFYPDGLDGS